MVNDRTLFRHFHARVLSLHIFKLRQTSSFNTKTNYRAYTPLVYCSRRFIRIQMNSVKMQDSAEV